MRLSVEALDQEWPPQAVAILAPSPKKPSVWAKIHEVTGPLALVKANEVADQLRDGLMVVDWKAGRLIPA